MNVTFPDDLVDTTGGRIVLLVLDGLGGLPRTPDGPTELEAASTPNLDALARRAALGLHRPVGHGITPGSGPGHLALFGYDPAEYNIGRGVLSALGVDFPLEPGDIAIRLNFASIDGDGRITDRRAGRPSDDENRRLIEKLREGVTAPGGLRIFFESEKEHRAVLIVRGRGLSAELGDTDPQETGVPPLPVAPLSTTAAETAQLLQHVLDRAFEVLADEKTANAILARGIDAYHPYPTFDSRYRLRAEAIARYPMYRGVARLLGMETQPGSKDDAESIHRLKSNFDSYDYHFVHFKAIDSRGEDGDFDAKVAAIEAADALVGEIDIQAPDVLVVTGDHSTPSKLRMHSWHPVPVMIVSEWTRPDPQAVFGERACARGELGVFPAKDLMTLMLAHAGRLVKFGA
ncbi:MAG: 2,3-bisphosphoglycerate-independent phosphoglycerate mutase [Longimicrobiales bacterium]